MFQARIFQGSKTSDYLGKSHLQIIIIFLRHLQLPDTVERLLLVTDVNKTTTVDPAYIEFTTQESEFLALVKKKIE